MAYRRRQGITKSATFKEEIYYAPPATGDDGGGGGGGGGGGDRSSSSSSSSSLAAQAIRASAVHRESSLSSAYGDSAFAYRDRENDPLRSKSFSAYGNSSEQMESKSGFWGVLARKAKSILEDEDVAQQFENPSRTMPQVIDGPVDGQHTHQISESFKRMDNPRFRKGLDRITTSLNQIGDTFEKAFEEGRTIVENKTADIIQETRKLQIRRKGSNLEVQNQTPGMNSSWQQPIQQQNPTNHETQLKASRDVAMATAAKAKLLLRELKTVKADLAFSKLRCSQLEEENKSLRESREKGANPADDDMIRLQLETLLAEKARLANENETYSRENRFLREIVEYHQLTMQDVVYIDEGIEEVAEVYPISYPSVASMLSLTPTTPKSPTSPTESPAPTKGEIFNLPPVEEEDHDGLEEEVIEKLDDSVTKEEGDRRPTTASA
ncbi:hypothetical protein EUGRSUZ_A00820 [Eucalyptus grandis]|uniref:Uncharacterized protein n=2 Tax=Eucalyptus grandis TaxID=71139 RepID=A0ACC3M1V8_EUCGR|nr:hypothetical protein EUGRSUZ_A00820 [Eucalyptus grandis]